MSRSLLGLAMYGAIGRGGDASTRGATFCGDAGDDAGEKVAIGRV